MSDSDAINAIAKAAGSADPGGAGDVSAVLSSLIKARDTVNKNTTWFANQPNSITSQGVGLTSQWVGLGAAGIGSGAAQILAPSFAAIRADETGISILGRKVFDFPFPKIVDRVMGKSEDPMITDIRDKLIGDLHGRKVAETFGALGSMNVEGHLGAIDNRIGDIGHGKSVAATFGSLGALNVSGHIDSLGNRIKSIEDRAVASKAQLEVEEKELRRIQAGREPKRVKGPQYQFSQAQIDSLEKSIKLLTEAIGI
ncbi:hypothetical protein ABH935_008528 [Catenulispora sp. GAS73]|uniref:hypothetical protein n=1 Tax=Catenulispora sp. GAS73 TaxID=3156269 RepID=UPI003517E030